MNVSTYRIFTTPQGQRIDTNRNHTADDKDPVLVVSTNDGWQKANVDGPVDRETVRKDYGFWTDKQLSHQEGWWWDRQEVIDRPLDGKVQADEVRLAVPQRLPDRQFGGYTNTFYLGSEVNKDVQGRLYLNENYHSFPPLLIIGSSQLNHVNGLIADDNNWQVPAKS